LSTQRTPSTVLQQRYVDALLACAQGTDVTREVTRTLTLIEASADLRAVVGSPVVTLAHQMRAVGAVLQAAGIAPVLQNFVAVILQNRRGVYLAGLLRGVLLELERRAGRAQAAVQVASPLSATQQQQLVQHLSQWSGRQVGLDIQVTPDIMGGLKVRLGSTQIDDSVAGKLARLEQQLRTRHAAA
jgi:F-type H+-transporting ATPase subunit delta